MDNLSVLCAFFCIYCRRRCCPARISVINTLQKLPFSLSPDPCTVRTHPYTYIQNKNVKYYTTQFGKCFTCVHVDFPEFYFRFMFEISNQLKLFLFRDFIWDKLFKYSRILVCVCVCVCV